MINVIVSAGATSGALGNDFIPVEVEGKPYQVQLVSIGLVVPTVITFPINPESWDRSYPQGWAKRGAPGVVRDSLDWSSNDPAATRFTALVQGDDPRILEATVLRPLERAREDLTRAAQEPPGWFLTFGTHQYRVVLTEVGIRRIRTNGAGDALTAEITIQALDQEK